jgi:lipopolysaccharide export system protein LptA
MHWGARAAAVALLAASSAMAADTATNATVITSRGPLTIDYKRSMAIFEDEVVVVDPQVRITCDRLTVMIDKQSEIKSVTATGNVRISSLDRQGTCRRAIYRARQGDVMLVGDARLTWNNGSLAGQEITFWIADERVECKPGHLKVWKAEGGSGMKDLRFLKPGTSRP